MCKSKIICNFAANLNSMAEKYAVYIHINRINGKKYVGITKYYNDPYKRWGNGSKYKHSVLFYKAIVKYNWENFDHFIFCTTTKENAIVLERTLIQLYKNIGISYNLAEGGEGTEAMSEETIEKLRKYTPWIKGKHHTEETKKRIAAANKKRVYGPLSEEHKKKLSISGKGKHTCSEELKRQNAAMLAKPVLQYDFNMQFIAEYPSAIGAERALNKKSNHIADCCNGKRKSTYGYFWFWK